MSSLNEVCREAFAKALIRGFDECAGGRGRGEAGIWKLCDRSGVGGLSVLRKRRKHEKIFSQ